MKFVAFAALAAFVLPSASFGATICLDKACSTLPQQGAEELTWGKGFEANASTASQDRYPYSDPVALVADRANESYEQLVRDCGTIRSKEKRARTRIFATGALDYAAAIAVSGSPLYADGAMHPAMTELAVIQKASAMCRKINAPDVIVHPKGQ